MIVSSWAASELAEIRQECWYPPESPMFRDHESGYRELTVSQREQNEKAGWVIQVLKINHRRDWMVIKLEYLDSVPTRRFDRNQALDRFGSVWATWSQFDGPTSAV